LVFLFHPGKIFPATGKQVVLFGFVFPVGQTTNPLPPFFFFFPPHFPPGLAPPVCQQKLPVWGGEKPHFLRINCNWRAPNRPPPLAKMSPPPPPFWPPRRPGTFFWGANRFLSREKKKPRGELSPPVFLFFPLPSSPSFLSPLVRRNSGCVPPLMGPLDAPLLGMTEST